MAYVLVRSFEVNAMLRSTETFITYSPAGDARLHEEITRYHNDQTGTASGEMIKMPVSVFTLLNALACYGYKVVSQSSGRDGQNDSLVTTWTLFKD